MRSKDESKFILISEEIKRFVIEKSRPPTQRELAEKIGMSRGGIYNYLTAMKQRGLIKGSARHLLTEGTELIAIPVVDSLADNKHIYDEATPSDYIFISRKPYGEGEFGIVRAIDNSMLLANIRPNDNVMIKRQKTAKHRQIVLAKTAVGQYILRRYIYDEASQTAMLEADSASDEFQNIYEFLIKGIVLNIISRIDG